MGSQQRCDTCGAYVGCEVPNCSRAHTCPKCARGASTSISEGRRKAFEEVQALLVQDLPWEERGRNVLALVTEYLTRPA